jgi:ribonuclease HI
MALQHNDVTTYLGCILDCKLNWTKHAEHVVSKARKKLPILKRLAGVKWGCSRDTLSLTYKTYIHPVLNYCNELLISASDNVLKLLDTFQNQALRLITGGVKTTPVLAMQLICDQQPMINQIRKNSAILFNRLIRLPNNSYWRDYDCYKRRNLKTQKGFIQCVLENNQYKAINSAPFELLSLVNPLDYTVLDVRLDLVLKVKKDELSPTALRAVALETIHTRFPSDDWIHIYTDGSLLDFSQGAGAGVYSDLFSFYHHAGLFTTHFDGELDAIRIALQQLVVRLSSHQKAVIFSDSISALQALSSNQEIACSRIKCCRKFLKSIQGVVAFQWVPSHCGLWGNEMADMLAKKGTGILQTFCRQLPLRSAKLEIKRIFKQSFRDEAYHVTRAKSWSSLCGAHCVPNSPRAAAVAEFRLLTGHDCLRAHLFRFNLTDSPTCILCDSGQDMTVAHLNECSALLDSNCIVVKYWRARGLMT